MSHHIMVLKGQTDRTHGEARMTSVTHRRAFRGSSSILALALIATGAHAQTEPAPAPQETPAAEGGDQDIVVTGIRASLASASDRKRNAGTTVDSIVAEDV